MSKKIKFLVIVVAVLFFGGLTYIFIACLDGKKANDSFYEIQEIHENMITESKFLEFKKINPEIIGWISINNTNINYPVLYRENDTKYYLEHNYKGEVSRYGSIVVSSLCDKDLSSLNTIVHGHHMKDGQMFANLKKFADIEFYKQNPIISFENEDGISKWKIFSFFKTNTLPEHGPLFNYCRSAFVSEKDFLEFISDLKKRSWYEVPLEVNANDKLMTLSTCSYEYKGFRTVLVARKIRQNEPENEGIDQAKKAANPVMPEVYSKKNN